MTATTTATTQHPGTQRSAVSFEVESAAASTSDERREEILANPGFGQFFTDHMVKAVWTPELGWHDAVVTGYGPFLIDPASAVLHYAQEIFEGLKAYRRADGSIWTFRADANARRLNRSAKRLALPELPEQMFQDAIDALVTLDRDWVPGRPDTSLYLRPFMFASEVFLGVRSARHVTFAVIASPAGSYFAGGMKPVSIWISTDYSRAAVGGMGAAKTGGNYASSLVAQEQAAAHGCEQVAFLDVVENRYLEELGGMNIFVVRRDGSVTTPALTGTILEGVTRDAILQVAADFGHEVREEQIAYPEIAAGFASGDVTEVFACGTAAVITPIGRFVTHDGPVTVGAGGIGPITAKIRERLVGIQTGAVEDVYGWTRQVVAPA
jgi:branched-chain amino acid aminotransferase